MPCAATPPAVVEAEPVLAVLVRPFVFAGSRGASVECGLDADLAELLRPTMVVVRGLNPRVTIVLGG